MTICTAKAKSTQQRCKNHATPGRTVCRFHGGKTLRGIASGTWKHGRYSKYLPTRLVERYEEALTDRELLNLTNEISLARTRLTDLLGRVDTHEARIHWKHIESDVDKLIEAVRNKDNDASNVALVSLREAVRAVRSDYAAWAEVMDLSERVRRLVDTESKRRKDMQLMIQVEDATSFFISSATLMREYVPPERLSEFTERLMELLHRSGASDNGGK